MYISKITNALDSGSLAEILGVILVPKSTFVDQKIEIFVKNANKKITLQRLPLGDQTEIVKVIPNGKRY